MHVDLATAGLRKNQFRNFQEQQMVPKNTICLWHEATPWTPPAFMPAPFPTARWARFTARRATILTESRATC